MDKALQTMINNMPEKTGKSLQQWFDVLSTQSLAKHGENLKYLKAEHGVTHGFANTITALYLQEREKQSGEGEVDLVAEQFKGKESLIPIYEKLLTSITKFGKDITITPKKTSVSIIRKHQFALIKPATKTRIDLGLKLKGVDNQGKLEGSGPFGTMCTHRIQLQTVNDIDKEVVNWLKQAYEMSV